MRRELKNLIKEYYLKNHKRNAFIPGLTPVKVSGRVFDQKEIENAVQASLEFWLTEGHFAEEFSKKLGKFLGVRYVSITNSGSSANLAAISALTSSKLGRKQIKKGDEIITVACSFPTTVNPITEPPEKAIFRASPIFFLAA